MTDRERALCRIAYDTGWMDGQQASRDGASEHARNEKRRAFESRVLDRVRPDLRVVEGALSAEK